jgi:hypothetical protein
MKGEMLEGHLDMIVLVALAGGPSHGYGILEDLHAEGRTIVGGNYLATAIERLASTLVTVPQSAAPRGAISISRLPLSVSQRPSKAPPPSGAVDWPNAGVIANQIDVNAMEAQARREPRALLPVHPGALLATATGDRNVSTACMRSSMPRKSQIIGLPIYSPQSAAAPQRHR